MHYRQLGNSDLFVSEIGLGTWGVYEGIDEERMQQSLFAAIDLGINLIDTSNSYAAGQAEEFLGRVLQSVPRSSYVLATKVFFPVPPGEAGLSAKQIKLNIDLSLRRLRTDYVDLYQCHRYDEQTPLQETLSALTDIVNQGKVRAIGFSEWSPAQIRSALQHENMVPFVSSQPQYSMLWRDPESEVFSLCSAHGIGQLAWSPLAQGILTGKYQPGHKPNPGSRAANAQMNAYLMRELFCDASLLAVQNLLPIAQSLKLTMPQLALAWVLRQPCVAAAIIGTSRPDQVIDNAGASGVHLPPSVIAEIDQILLPVLAGK